MTTFTTVVSARKRGAFAVTDVELTSKEWKRVLGWYSVMFKKNKPNEADTKLINKIQCIYDAEKEFEDSIEEDD